ncbi:MAG: hypothetical protein CM15mP83_7180 [Flavobacteriaceae bacterium]|nr:MAG: hypothetical protein CM15mP83_7180 [Flavobacteriaceae bacterium]
MWVKIAQLAWIFLQKNMWCWKHLINLLARLDRTQLIRILTNLVKNAIQACTETPNPSILVQVEGIDNKVCIRVVDNGSGIATENLFKIFEPKFTTKSSGMGLGLPIVKNIVETYEGHIEVESNSVIGTVFRVWLPLVNAET